MSNNELALQRVLESLQLPPTAVRLLLTIHSVGEKRGPRSACWLTQAKICESTNASERAVRMAIRALESAGLIRTKRSRSLAYCVDWSRVFNAQPLRTARPSKRNSDRQQLQLF